MYKKLLVCGLILGSLSLGGMKAQASEISDTEQVQDKIVNVTNMIDKLKEERQVLAEEKAKREGLEINVTQKAKVVVTPLTGESKLETKTTADKIEEKNTQIKNQEQSLNELNLELKSIQDYESFLEKQKDSLSVDSDSKKKEIQSKINEINTKIESINSYNIDVEDNSLKDSVLDTLNKAKDSLQNRLDSYVGDGQKVVNQALKYLGVPYVWGGKVESGMDCSGLTQLAYRKALGMEIGIWTVAQESSGTVVSVSEAQVGDLLFWGSHGSTHHVAIYMGDGKFIQAPQPGDVVRITNISDFTPDFAMHIVDND